MSEIAHTQKAKKIGAAFAAGAIVQGLVLGLLLWEAILTTKALEDGMRIFKYQGF